MSYIQDALEVLDLAALVAMSNASTPPRVDRGLYYVRDAGDGLGRWAQYLASSTETITDDILMPDDELGRWHLSTGGVDLSGYQPLDADLTAYAALATTGLVERTGSGTVATVPVTAFAKGLLDDADATAAQTTLGLVIGTNVQPYSARLDSVAGLSATSGVVEKTGANTFGTFTVSSFAKTYLDETSQLNTQIVLGLVPGQDVQPYSARLLQLSGIVASSGTIEKVDANTFGTYAVSSFAKSFLFQTTAADVRGTLGATTIGGNLFTLANPGAIAFPRFNANNSVSALNAADFRTAIAAAAADHTHPYDAAISLTPQNSFTTFGGGLYENSLTIYPALKLAVLRFALARTSIPANETVALTWSSAYATNRGIIAINPGCNLTAQTATPLILGYVQGNELKFNYPRTESATAIAYLVGSITFTYA